MHVREYLKIKTFLFFRFNDNFGSMGWLDWFHGTDKRYRKTAEHQRHGFLLTLTPAKIHIPDIKKQG